MNTCLDIKNPLLRNGLSQQERLLDALIPENFKLDDRSMKDLLAFTHQYAEMVAYFDEDNKHNGNWTCFWEIEPLVLLATLASMDTDIIALEYKRAERAYRNSKKRFEEDENCKVDESPAFIDQLIRSIYDIARHIQDIFAKLPDLDALKEFKGQIRDLVVINFKGDKEELQKALVKLIAYDKFAHGAELNDYEPFIYSPLWNLTRDDYFCILPSADLTLEDLRKLFLQFLKALKKLVGLANSHFDRLMANDKALHEPHIALFITFLRLFQHAQDFLNSLTKKHLDYYYEQVLCLHRRPEQADEVHVIFELAKDFHLHHIEKGTLLDAGGGLQYETVEEWTVNSAQVAQIKTIYLKKIEDDFQIHALPAADTEDGEKQSFQDPNAAYWRLFGDYDGGIPQEKAKAEKNGEVGFAIASYILLLKEGTRKITFTFEQNDSVQGLQGLVIGDFDFFFSTEKNWFKHQIDVSNQISTLQIEENQLIIILEIPPAAPPVVPITDPKGLPLSDLPTAKFFLKNTRYYEAFWNAKLDKITINVDVTGVEDLILQTPQGIFAAKQSFQPFGPNPKSGEVFYIGSNEIFEKPVEKFSLHFEWVGKPDNFNTYYKSYIKNNDEQFAPLNTFLLSASILYDGKLQNYSQEDFFRDNGIIEDRIDFEIPPPDLANIPIIRRLHTPITKIAPSIKNGFAEIKLSMVGELTVDRLHNVVINGGGSSEDIKVKRNFLHDAYAIIAANAAIARAKEGVNDIAFPNPPYTPTVRGIRIDYFATHKIDTQSKTDEFFFLTPFKGHKERAKNDDKPLYLFGQADFNKPNQQSESSHGNLYLGIKDLRPGQNLALLVQVRDGSEREFDADPPEVVWSYLGVDNEWLPIAASRILQDDTLGLTRSGIIQLAIPYDIVKENTLLDSTLSWLRAAVVEEEDKKIGAFPDVIAIKAQAIKAHYRRQDRESAHLAAALPPKTIKKLAVADFHVKKVEQPYPSFNGKISEQGNEFYRRVSERLRHRDRAVTIYDYEHLLLEQYPAVQRVRCLNHTRRLPDGILRELAPGYVTIAVIPTLRNRNIFNRAQPRVPIGKRREMEAWLRTKTNLFVRGSSPQGEPYLRVVNPQYESLQVKCRVTFKPKLDQEYYKQRLDEDIKRLLAPWMFDDSADIIFGRIIYQSRILYFIETREYVEAVADFSVQRNGDTDQKIECDAIMPINSHGILTTFIKSAKAENETDHEISSANELAQLCLPEPPEKQPRS